MVISVELGNFKQQNVKTSLVSGENEAKIVIGNYKSSIEEAFKLFDEMDKKETKRVIFDLSQLGSEKITIALTKIQKIKQSFLKI